MCGTSKRAYKNKISQKQFSIIFSISSCVVGYPRQSQKLCEEMEDLQSGKSQAPESLSFEEDSLSEMPIFGLYVYEK